MEASFQIACKGCAYCSDRCPLDIPIAEYFSIYNEWLLAESAEKKNSVLNRYEEAAQKHTKASDCLKCGRCEPFCPEHLPIMGFLQDIAEEIEEY